VEHVIREDFNVEALEILELYCELLLARFGLVESMKHCDAAISEAVNTIIYAAPRTDIVELSLARDQLMTKYGKEFSLAAMENVNDQVNTRIVQKLKIQTPDPMLVNQYLSEIARAYNVSWVGLEPQGVIVPLDPRLLSPQEVKELDELQPSKSELPEFPEFPTVPTVTRDESVLSTPDFDDLTKRFEALKRRSAK
jgi:hypothetical protein